MIILFLRANYLLTLRSTWIQVDSMHLNSVLDTYR